MRDRLGPDHLPPAEYWEHRLGRDFSLGGTGHLGLGRAFNTWTYRARLGALRRALRRNGIEVRGARVLEIGVGTGFFVPFWLERGASSVLGLDITQRSVQELSARYPRLRFAVQDISDAACPRYGEFDIVTVFDVLFHLLDEGAFVRAVSNACVHLGPGGVLLITDVLSEHTELRGQTQHSRRLEAYRRALGAHGLTSLALHPIFFSMQPPIDLRPGGLHRAGQIYWRALSAILARAPAAGHPLGLLTCLIDLGLQHLLTRGPSVKLLVARSDGRI